MVDPEQIAQLRTQAGLSPTPPSATQPDTSNILATRKAALGITETPSVEKPSPSGVTTSQTAEQMKNDPLRQIAKTTATDYSKAVPNFVAEAGRNDASTNKNPIIRTGENALAATASGLGTVFAPISNAIKTASDTFANSSAGNAVANNPIAGKLLDVFGGSSKALNDWATAHPEAARNLGGALTVALSAVGDEPINKATEAVKTGAEKVGNLATKGINSGLEVGYDDATKVASKVGDAAHTVKEGFVPTATPDEATGQIVQGTPEDVPAANRALSSLDTRGVKTYTDLHERIKAEIPKLAKQVDAEFSKDPTGGHSIKSFEQSIGEGKGAVKVNYVRQAIDQLRDHFEKTNDAQGLAKIKTLENTARIKGLTYKDVNNLARLHGQTINAFNANGEAASGLSKQTAENTRSGLKGIARQGLGGKEAEALDKKLSDLYDTQALIEKQVNKVNALAQKTPKQGIIPKVVGKTVSIAVKAADALTGNPLKAIGKEIGLGGNQPAMSALEIEKNLAKNLRILRGK